MNGGFWLTVHFSRAKGDYAERQVENFVLLVAFMLLVKGVFRAVCENRV